MEKRATVPGEVPASAQRQAEELVQRVAEATRFLPFGAEPANVLEVLEQLAATAEEGECRA
ncbi:hypothetical protein HRbin40_01965 [bacterium HR40]|nr:hypothetical protein HRbin40_01965 [bacterium HR40]